MEVSVFKSFMKAFICVASGFGAAVLMGRWLQHTKGLVAPTPQMKDFLKERSDEFVAFKDGEVLFHTKDSKEAQEKWAKAGTGSILFVPIDLCRWGLRWEH